MRMETHGRNRKCFNTLHPSLSPDVISSERTSSCQHEVQWAQPPGSTRSRLYGKPLQGYQIVIYYKQDSAEAITVTFSRH